MWRWLSFGDTGFVASKKPLLLVVSKLRYYPVVVFVCWVTPCINDLSPYQPSEIVSFLAATLPGLQGLGTCVCFWLTSPDARKKVRDFVCPPPAKMETDFEFSIASTSVEEPVEERDEYEEGYITHVHIRTKSLAVGSDPSSPPAPRRSSLLPTIFSKPPLKQPPAGDSLHPHLATAPPPPAAAGGGGARVRPPRPGARGRDDAFENVRVGRRGGGGEGRE